MKTIWKFEVFGPDILTEMPEGAKILDVQVQNGSPMLWALVDPSAPKAQRHFKIWGTGHEMPDEPGEHLGTFQTGMFVFHVFELPLAGRKEK